jgi:hypothetical protein
VQCEKEWVMADLAYLAAIVGTFACCAVVLRALQTKKIR